MMRVRIANVKDLGKHRADQAAFVGRLLRQLVPKQQSLRKGHVVERNILQKPLTKMCMLQWM